MTSATLEVQGVQPPPPPKQYKLILLMDEFDARALLSLCGAIGGYSPRPNARNVTDRIYELLDDAGLRANFSEFFCSADYPRIRE